MLRTVNYLNGGEFQQSNHKSQSPVDYLTRDHAASLCAHIAEYDLLSVSVDDPGSVLDGYHHPEPLSYSSTAIVSYFQLNYSINGAIQNRLIY